jgi:hypothetical protein
MELLTKDLEQALPPIHSDASIAQVKFFTPWTHWTWYATEASAELEDGSEVSLQDPRAKDRVDVIFFGLVYGLEKEYGYWHLSELTEIHGPVGLKIERDLHFAPTPLEECKDPTRLHR